MQALDLLVQNASPAGVALWCTSLRVHQRQTTAGCRCVRTKRRPQRESLFGVRVFEYTRDRRPLAATTYVVRGVPSGSRSRVYEPSSTPKTDDRWLPPRTW